MNDPMDGTTMVDLALRRIMIRDDSERQYIFLQECRGKRSFLIVIGTNEAQEIQRVVLGQKPERPLTHQLAYDAIRALGADLKRVDIVDMHSNTYYAQLVLQRTNGELAAVVDARPSDAVALALRAKCPLRIAESVLEQVRSDDEGPDPLPGPEASESDE